MYGFTISCINKESDVKHNPLNKFKDDKTFCRYDNGDVAVLDGVLLNKKALYEKYTGGAQDLNDLIFKCAQQREDFFSEFRGPFSGAYFSASKNQWTVFTNHIADSAVFYHASGRVMTASSDPKSIIEILSREKINLTVDETAVYNILTYGYMTDESTYCHEIKRLLPGQYLRYSVDTGEHSISQYYEVKDGKLDLSGMTEQEAIERLDRLFTESIELGFGKDREYGYRHFCELSGGLDSRMVYWIAHELGYKDCLTFTFGQGGCLDEKIARAIADYWNEEIIVMPSNTAKFMTDVIDLTASNHGASIYYGTQMEPRGFEIFNMDRFGLIHTGQLGGSVIGTYVSKPDQLSHVPAPGEKAYSDMLVGHYEDKNIGKFGNYDEQSLVTRGMLGCCGTHFITRKYTEVCSATINPDLIDFCLSLPIEWRINRRLYRKWIATKHPEAAQFIWATKNQKITDSENAYFIRKKLAKLDWVRRNPKVILKKLGLKVKDSPQVHGKREEMSPVDKWYNTVPGIKEKMDELYDTLFRKHTGIFSEKLSNDIKYLYAQGGATEKGLVLTALGAVEHYFG